MKNTRFELSRRQLVRAAAASATSSLIGQHHSHAQRGDIARETSIDEIRRAYDVGEYTISEFVESCLRRISQLDQAGPWLDAMIELNPDAERIAEELDTELAAGRSRGPLHGIPVVVKDVFATNDQMETTAGSLAMVGTRASRDAFIVERMREAGMVILGKTNLTEWSGYRPVLYGWSSRGDLTVNPYVTTQTTWGSSSGSAVAVAASYAPVAVGLETDGSIICPASACGVVGIKPTVGLTSRQGILLNGYTLDSPGVMGRSVADAAALLSVIAGYDPEDIAFGEHAQHFPAGERYSDFVQQPGKRDYRRAITDDGLDGVRIGVVRGYWGFSEEADRHAENALLALAEAGAELIEDVTPPGLYEIGFGEAGLVMGIEFPRILKQYLSTYAPGGEITSLEDLAGWYEEHPDIIQWAYEDDPFYLSQFSEPEWSKFHVEMITSLHTASRRRGIDGAISRHNLDALVAPTCALPTHWTTTQHYWSSSSLAATAGYPSITVPIGYTEHLPAGLHFFGAPFTERRLIRYAAVLERELQARVAPEYLEYTDYDDLYLPGDDELYGE